MRHNFCFTPLIGSMIISLDNRMTIRGHPTHKRLISLFIIISHWDRTPICPHNLTIRPLVVPNTAEVRLKVEGRSGEYVLCMDSRIRKMTDGQELKICTGSQKINVVKLPRHNYYDTLRNKLMWGEDRRNGMKD